MGFYGDLIGKLMGFYGDLMGIDGIEWDLLGYTLWIPLVNIQKTIEHQHFIAG